MSERPAATDTTALREQRDILLFRQKEQSRFLFFFFFETVHPCVHAWGVHTVLWEGFELTQVTVAPSPVWRRKRRRRGDELFNQPAPLGSDVLLCLMGRWGNNKQHLLTRRAATWQPQDRASKEPRFSRGQGIISESSSRIIARSQNDSPSLRHSITDCCSITPHKHRIKWQPCPLIARHLSLRKCSFWLSLALMLLYHSSAIFSSEIHYLPLRWSLKAHCLWGWGKTGMLDLFCNAFLPLSKNSVIQEQMSDKSVIRTDPQQSLCSAGESHWQTLQKTKKKNKRKKQMELGVFFRCPMSSE